MKRIIAVLFLFTFLIGCANLQRTLTGPDRVEYADSIVRDVEIIADDFARFRAAYFAKETPAAVARFEARYEAKLALAEDADDRARILSEMSRDFQALLTEIEEERMRWLALEKNIRDLGPRVRVLK